jgi:hypothetical protein
VVVTFTPIRTNDFSGIRLPTHTFAFLYLPQGKFSIGPQELHRPSSFRAARRRNHL